MSLTSAEGLEHFKWTANNIFYKDYENLLKPVGSEVLKVFHLTQDSLQMDVE
jgi:hypothetical protein